MFYTYAYLREDGSPYYIGKGTGRRIDSVNHRVAVPPKNRRLKLKDNLSEEEAYRHEMYMIGVLGRKDLGTGILINMSDGGGADSGYKHSEERRRKMSEAVKGRPKSEEWKAKMREIMKGKNKGKTPWNKGLNPEDNPQTGVKRGPYKKRGCNK